VAGKPRRAAEIAAARLSWPRANVAGGLLYSRGLVRSAMIEPGRGLAYAALFSEIGISLLVTTLIGVLAGYWADGQLGTLPIFVIVGFLAGAGTGTLMIYRLVTKFLATIK
jgi:hypothetical protein